jgi:hypothetical protein
MDMDVDKSWRDYQSINVNQRLAPFRFQGSDRGNATTANSQISSGIDTASRIHDAAAPQQDGAAHRSAHRAEKNRLAVRFGPGDGAAAAALVMYRATDPLVSGVCVNIPAALIARQNTRRSSALGPVSD